jgi:hypothetical protein
MAVIAGLDPAIHLTSQYGRLVEPAMPSATPMEMVAMSARFIILFVAMAPVLSVPSFDIRWPEPVRRAIPDCDAWTDGCNHCSVHDGRILCTALGCATDHQPNYVCLKKREAFRTRRKS